MNKLSTKHLVFLILAVTIISLRTYSSLFIAVGGRDTWVAAIIAGVLFSIFTLFIMYVSKKTDSFDFRKIFKDAYPKPLGEILLFIFALGLLFTCIETASAEASSIHTNIFIETPYWYCLLFFIVPSGYILLKKFQSLLTVVLLTLSAIIANDLFLEIFIWKYQHYKYLLPIMNNNSPSEFILTILLILGSLSSVAIVFPYLKFLKKSDKLIRHTGFAVVLLTLLAINTMVSVISTFGPDRAANIFNPEFIQAQRIQLYGFIEFGNLMFLFRIVCGWFLKYILCASAILYLYKDRVTNKKFFSIIFSTVIFISAYYIGKNQFFLYNILKYYELLMLVIFILIPFTTYLVHFLKNRSKH